ncbi:MAG TPA: hypothetical protein VF786_14860, partial [Terriglobales bacterium]
MRLFGLIILLLCLTLPMAAQQAQPATATFSQADAETLVRTLQDGLEGHNLKRFISAFDRQQMIDYRDFSDQVTALFSRTDAFRVNLHVSKFEDAGDGRANVTMDAQMEI